MQKLPFFIVMLFSVILCRAQVTELVVKNGEKGLYLEHKVAAKEGLYAIGRLYNVSPKHIAAFNKMDLNQGLEIDQLLRIPLSDTNFSQKSTSGTPVYYEVGPGEGLLKVSNVNNKVSLKSLRDWNDLTSDNLHADSKLIVGFLLSKEMVALIANNRVKKIEAPKKQEDKPVVKTEPVATVKQEVVQEKKKEELPKVMPPATKEETQPVFAANGFFKNSFDQQVRTKPVSKNSTVTSGIFKTNSGWQDAKYYLLIDGVSPGTIIRVINPDNNKAVYAKVLGEMNGIRQNQGLDIRISNAAASALQIKEEDKFVVKVNY